MGGVGSGRYWHCGAKSTTSEYRSIDVRHLEREGMLRPGYTGTWAWTRCGAIVASIVMRAEKDRVILVYRQRADGEEWKDEQYAVRIVRTQCNLGGSRSWFICPAAGCGRRIAILYGGDIFVCRHCRQLAYVSSREDIGDRAARKANQIRARLGWEPGILNDPGFKPKWMRWKTYERLVAQHDELVRRCMNASVLKLGLLKRNFRD